MKKITVSFLMFLIGASFALPLYATGFSGGDQFSTVNIEGRLSVQCTGPTGTSSAFADCRGQLLNPGEYSYFVGPQVDADHVTLSATREDGSVSKSKTEEYDSAKGKSKKSFNLWISTVFQRPLLGFGKNIVKYSLTQNGKVIDGGTFITTVVAGGRSVCQRTGFYFSNSSSDCSMPTNFCARYFNENNYCQ